MAAAAHRTSGLSEFCALTPLIHQRRDLERHAEMYCSGGGVFLFYCWPVKRRWISLERKVLALYTGVRAEDGGLVVEGEGCWGGAHV